MTTPSYNHTGLSAGTTRHYRVSAINAVGTGSASATASATTAMGSTTFTPIENTDGSTTLLEGTLTAASLPEVGNGSIGYSRLEDNYGSLSVSPSFTVDSHTYTLARLHIYTASNPKQMEFWLSGTGWGATGAGGDAERKRWVLYWNNQAFSLDVPSADASDQLVEWKSGVPGVAASDTVPIRLVRLNAPTAPTNLTATTATATQISLSWSAPSKNGGSDITGYKIEVSTDGSSNWTNLVADTALTTPSYNHTGLSAGTTRHYRVSAINAVGTGSASATASATTAMGSTTFTPIENTDGSTTLLEGTLTAASLPEVGNGSIGYSRLEDNYGSLSVSPSFTVDSHTYTLARLHIYTASNPKQMEFWLSGTGWGATGAGGDAERKRWVLYWNNQAFSLDVPSADASDQLVEWKSGVPGVAASDTVPIRLVRLNAPTAPRDLHAKGDSTTQIDLSWDAPAKDGGTDITGYKIEVSTDGNTFTDLVEDTNLTDTAYSHTGLSMGDTRHYRVSAINVVGTSPVSNTASATAVATPRG